MSHKAKIGCGHIDVQLLPCVAMSLESVQPPLFVCYTLGLLGNMSSVP